MLSALMAQSVPHGFNNLEVVSSILTQGAIVSVQQLGVNLYNSLELFAKFTNGLEVYENNLH